MKEAPLSKVYQLLEPGPVVLLTTSFRGRANVMTLSWHMMVEFTPPMVACVVSSANQLCGAPRDPGGDRADVQYALSPFEEWDRRPAGAGQSIARGDLVAKPCTPLRPASPKCRRSC